VSVAFLTYLWHYLAARAIYDELFRPLTRGHPGPLLWTGIVAALAFCIGRWSAPRSRL
jgi:hypothetical protein